MRLKPKILLPLVAAAVLCVPAVSVAGDSSSSPSKSPAKRGTPHANLASPGNTCKSQRNASGFAASHNGQTFTESYGTNRGKGRGAGANAFGKCVSMIAKHKTENAGEGNSESHGKDSAKSHGDASAESEGKDSEGNDNTESHGKNGATPAMTCKGMQANDLANFQTTYGTRPNAFGKCVAGWTRGQKG